MFFENTRTLLITFPLKIKAVRDIYTFLFRQDLDIVAKSLATKTYGFRQISRGEQRSFKIWGQLKKSSQEMELLES